MSNLAQMGKAMQQYTQDYDERFPIGGYMGSPTGPLVTALDSLQPYIKNYQIAVCPSDSKPHDIDFSPLSVVPGQSYSYTTNDVICDSPDFGGKPPVSLAQVTRSTAEVPLMWDGRNTKTFSFMAPTTTIDLQVAKRHFDGANCAFVDGHVKYYVNKPPYSDPDPADELIYWNAYPGDSTP